MPVSVFPTATEREAEAGWVYQALVVVGVLIEGVGVPRPGVVPFKFVLEIVVVVVGP